MLFTNTDDNTGIKKQGQQVYQEESFLYSLYPIHWDSEKQGHDRVKKGSLNTVKLAQNEPVLIL